MPVQTKHPAEAAPARSWRDPLNVVGVRGRWYLAGPAFTIASFFWLHYSLGLTRLVGILTFPDLVCIFGCLIIFAYLVATLFIQLTQFRTHCAVIGFACGAASMFCIALPYEFNLSFGGWGILGAFLFAVYLITYWLLWFDQFKQQSVAVAVVSVLLSTALGYCLAWFVLGITGLRAVWALFGIMLLSAVALLNALRNNPRTQKAWEKQPHFSRVPFGFTLVSLAFSASYMYTITINGLDTFHSVFNWDLLISSLGLLALVFVLRKQLTLAMFFSLASPLLIIGLLVSLFTDLNHVLLFNLFHLGYFSYLVFILILYRGFAKDQKVDSFRLACLLILSIFIGCFVGRLLYPAIEIFFPEIAQNYLSVFSVIVIGILIVCTMYGLRTIYRLFATNLEHPPFEVMGVEDESAMSGEQIAHHYGLSERESEVLRLLLEGKSATQIAQNMVIAHGTAKAHIRNVYKKIDIHHRDELFALVAQREGGRDSR